MKTKEQEMKTKEQEMRGKVEIMGAREQEVKARERENDARERENKAIEVKNKEKAQENQAKERELKEREQELKRKEQQLVHKEQQLQTEHQTHKTGETGRGAEEKKKQVVDVAGVRYSRQFDFRDKGRPRGMTSDGNHLFVCDGDNNCVKVFEKKGTFLRKFGKEGSNDGEFYDPWFLAYHESELFVSEFVNQRIQVVSVEGVFKRKISLDFNPQGSPFGSKSASSPTILEAPFMSFLRRKSSPQVGKLRVGTRPTSKPSRCVL